jgi:hypothetical protein
MTDVTEQFAEIMNKTIQEAADADERTRVAETQLAAAVAAQDHFCRKAASREAYWKDAADAAEEELAEEVEEGNRWEARVGDLEDELDQLKSALGLHSFPNLPSSYYTAAGSALSEVREYLERFDHDEVKCFDQIVERECPGWLIAFKADMASDDQD